MGVNKVILLGRLGKDPELRMTPSQMAVARFSLATGDRKKDQSGNWVEHTEWHNIVAFGKNAENASKYLKKGREVYIEGKIRTNKWQDKEGKDRYTTEILADNVTFVGGGKGESEMPSNSEMPVDSILDSFPSADSLARPAAMKAAVGAEQPITFDDDDIPF